MSDRTVSKTSAIPIKKETISGLKLNEWYEWKWLVGDQLAYIPFLFSILYMEEMRCVRNFKHTKGLYSKNILISRLDGILWFRNLKSKKLSMLINNFQTN